MSDIITVGLDLAKNVFQVHGADGAGRAVLRKKLRRTQVLAFFSQLPRCVVAMEVHAAAPISGAREIGKLGHEVRLTPARLRQTLRKAPEERCFADAEAICEAAVRPSMRFVPVKSEGVQGAATVFRVRELLIRQRTQAIRCASRPPGRSLERWFPKAQQAASLVRLQYGAEVVGRDPLMACTGCFN